MKINDSSFIEASPSNSPTKKKTINRSLPKDSMELTPQTPKTEVGNKSIDADRTFSPLKKVNTKSLFVNENKKASLKQESHIKDKEDSEKVPIKKGNFERKKTEVNGAKKVTLYFKTNKESPEVKEQLDTFGDNTITTTK